MADEKTSLRHILSECRMALPPGCARTLSLAIAHRVLALSAYHRAAAVVLYASTQNEVATDLIFERALADGKLVGFPCVERRSRTMTIVEARSPAELSPGPFGIIQPRSGRVLGSADLVQGLIIVPGLAFTATGDRLGRGQGYYDRFLGRLDTAVTMGLCYSFQLLERLPRQTTDRSVNLVITESATYSISSGKEAAVAGKQVGGVTR